MTEPDAGEQTPITAPTLEKRRFSLDSALLIVLALCVIALWALQLHPYLNPADDSGRYMVLGDSLAKTGELRLINDVHRWRDTLYVPGFPAIIAFWLKVTGADPGGVVLQVKFTQLLFLLGTLPLFANLLRKIGLSAGIRRAILCLYALCPTLSAYANEVMSEIPILFLILSAMTLVEQSWSPEELPAQRVAGEETWAAKDFDLVNRGISGTPHSQTPTWKRILGLVCAALSYYVRAAGVILLISFIAWFWKRYGWKWGAAAGLVAMLVVGSWQVRNSKITKEDFPRVQDTYFKQFTLRDPEKLDSGRIQMNVMGLLSRAKRGFPPYIGNISRAALYIMAPPRTPALAFFYVAAIPFTLLVFLGYLEAMRRKLWLSVGFSALYWLFVAMWPWINARFLVPVLPLIFMFLGLGAERFSLWIQNVGQGAGSRGGVRTMGRIALAVQISGCLLILGYYVRVYSVIVRAERKPTLAGYALGRTKDEAGFYAACAWLKTQEPETVVMGRPAYLLYLYSGHPATQIEPTLSARAHEKAYVLPNKVRYLLYDAWYWSKTAKYLTPYLQEYGEKWDLAWEDSKGSGVKVYRRR